MLKSDFLTAIFTGGMFLVGVVQLIMFWRQLKIMGVSLTDAEDAAKTAKESADATRDIVSTLQDNARKQMRAHVFTDNAGIMDESSFNPRIPNRINQPWISYLIRNSGFTPAYKLIHWGMAAIIDVTDEASLVPPPLNDTHKIVLPPGGVSTKGFWFGRALTEEEIRDINSFRKAIYIYGAIQYQDIHGRVHKSTYRLKYAGLYPPAGSGTFSFCEEGNDEEEERQT